MQKLLKAAKAVAGAVVPLVSVALASGSFNWKAIAAAAVGALAVYFVPNAQPEVQAFEDVFAAPASYAPVSALKPEVAPTPPVVAPVAPAAPVTPPTTPPAA